MKALMQHNAVVVNRDAQTAGFATCLDLLPSMSDLSINIGGAYASNK